MKYPPYYVSQSQFCKRDDQNGVIETVANSIHSLKKPIISKKKRKETVAFEEWKGKEKRETYRVSCNYANTYSFNSLN